MIVTDNKVVSPGVPAKDCGGWVLVPAKEFMQSLGGSWTWNRRAFVLETNGRRPAVSVASMPHAGVDGGPFLQNVDNRSGGYGYDPNYDAISGNGMDGHFDMYFLNSQTHVDNTLDPARQYLVLLAGGLQ